MVGYEIHSSTNLESWELLNFLNYFLYSFNIFNYQIFDVSKKKKTTKLL